MAIDHQTADELLSVLQDRVLQADIAKLRAQGVLRDIRADAPDYDWRVSWPRVLRNATGALVGLEVRAVELARGADEYAPGRRLAQLWETIAKLQEHGDRSTALANAALAYELSGYQAAAAVLARDLARSLPEGPSFVGLVANFLQRQFLLVKSVGPQLLAQPDIDLPPRIARWCPPCLDCTGSPSLCPELCEANGVAIAENADHPQRVSRPSLLLENFLKTARDALGRSASWQT